MHEERVLARARRAKPTSCALLGSTSAVVFFRLLRISTGLARPQEPVTAWGAVALRPLLAGSRLSPVSTHSGHSLCHKADRRVSRQRGAATFAIRVRTRAVAQPEPAYQFAISASRGRASRTGSSGAPHTFVSTSDQLLLMFDLDLITAASQVPVSRPGAVISTFSFAPVDIDFAAAACAGSKAV